MIIPVQIAKCRMPLFSAERDGGGCCANPGLNPGAGSTLLLLLQERN